VSYLEFIASLVASVAWPLALVVCALLLRSRILEMLGRLRTFKFGDAEFQLAPQDASTQKAKAEIEMRELVQATNAAGAVASLGGESSLRRHYFQAEDLALRAIQAQYGKPINRQVNLAGLAVDGAFTIDGRLHVVEVKYSIHRMTVATIRDALDRIVTGIQRSSWKNVQVILALVLDKTSDGMLSDAELARIVSDCSVPVRIMQFELSALQSEFGVAP
jgi:hypothetical protein